jgi:ubiquinone/menaquinone biosynthesis C-methylase UbiE
MHKIFNEMFSKSPYEIINNDYYYDTFNMPQLKNPVGYKELYEFKINVLLENDFFHITKRTQKFNEVPELVRACQELSDSNKPFMEIGCGEGMGFVPHIIKMNPQISCLATDIDAFLIGCWRLVINDKLSEYNISLAAFDNDNMPIKNNALDYVTSYFGINKITQINEIYRILKPGGCAIIMHSYDDVQTELLNKMKANDPFKSAGFEIEVRENYFDKISPDSIVKIVNYEVINNSITHFRIIEKTAEDCYGAKINKKGFFYILRKPN